tara:strand:- start:3 stop:284 length:282 start_codon:yes stop_codon:yes gene_type:complete
MYRWERSDKLVRILKKLYKKDKVRYESILKKINEIILHDDPHHYKNLSPDLKQFKRVHIDSHFVLIFVVDENNKVIRFVDLQHHDIIYQRKKR